MARSAIVRIAFAWAVMATVATAQPRERIKVGVLTDMGGAMSDYAGRRSVAAAQLAIADFRAGHAGFDVELVSADSQNKPDVASAIARGWFDTDGVDAIVDVPNSAVVLALSELVRDKNKALLSTSASSSRITGEQCTPNTINWTYSTWALAHGASRSILKAGGRSWFFITLDLEYGRSVSAEMRRVIEAGGGKVVGTAGHPLGTTDYSSYTGRPDC